MSCTSRDSVANVADKEAFFIWGIFHSQSWENLQISFCWFKITLWTIWTTKWRLSIVKLSFIPICTVCSCHLELSRPQSLIWSQLWRLAPCAGPCSFGSRQILSKDWNFHQGDMCHAKNKILPGIKGLFPRHQQESFSPTLPSTSCWSSSQRFASSACHCCRPTRDPTLRFSCCLIWILFSSQ